MKLIQKITHSLTLPISTPPLHYSTIHKQFFISFPLFPLNIINFSQKSFYSSIKHNCRHLERIPGFNYNNINAFVF